jgi:hypothetical protein
MTRLLMKNGILLAVGGQEQDTNTTLSEEAQRVVARKHQPRKSFGNSVGDSIDPPGAKTERALESCFHRVSVLLVWRLAVCPGGHNEMV